MNIASQIHLTKGFCEVDDPSGGDPKFKVSDADKVIKEFCLKHQGDAAMSGCDGILEKYQKGDDKGSSLILIASLNKEQACQHYPSAGNFDSAIHDCGTNTVDEKLCGARIADCIFYSIRAEEAEEAAASQNPEPQRTCSLHLTQHGEYGPGSGPLFSNPHAPLLYTVEITIYDGTGDDKKQNGNSEEMEAGDGNSAKVSMNEAERESEITPEKQDDYVQFNLSGQSWKSSDESGCSVGGWDPRENFPAPRSRDDQEVLDLSRKCSELGKELLKELDKLRLEKGRLRQALLKSVLAHRRKAAIKEKQELLDHYQRVLDTRILGRLDARSLKETQDVRCLDQSVQQLVHELERGNNTVAQLLANHKDILDSIEGRLENNQRTTANQQLLESLFFPEIDSREDQIQDAFDGTCRWIFNSSTETWSNFRKWLETENGVYWISGKPGAGKSTLMKYIVREDSTSQLLANWERGTDLLVLKFFFWHTGSTLQRSLEGLLMSLLHQIADQWPGLVGFLDARKGKGSGETEEPRTLRLPKWTEQRLLSLLKRFLEQKPGSITVCAFIDGLDEFIGDEDTLLDIIRFFSKTPRCKICVSSRPEQAFRHEFQLCSKLRVQDLNRQDIKQMIDQRLLPCLETHRCTSQDGDYLRMLVESLIDKSSGVFLWLDLVIRDLIQGFRNEDTLEELQSRIDRTPDTIHALIEPEPWEFITRSELEYFTSARFRSTCERLETRLVSRCGGLLEIHHKMVFGIEYGPLAYYDRMIRFMHRTAIEFLREEYKTVFLDVPSSAFAAAQAARRAIGSLVLVSVTKQHRTRIYHDLVAASRALTLLGFFSRESGMEESFGTIQLNLTRQAVGSLQSIHKERDHSWKRGFFNDISFWEWLLNGHHTNDEEVFVDLTSNPWCPIVDDLSIAAYFGFHSYFQSLATSQVCSVDRMSTMLHAVQSGYEDSMEESHVSFVVYRAVITTVQEILRYDVNPNAIFSIRPDIYRYMQHGSLWARVLVILLEVTKLGLDENTTIHLWWQSYEACCTDMIERLLNLGADPNTRITVCYRFHLEGGVEAFIYVEESPLAVWNWLDRRIAQRLTRIEAQLRLAGATSFRRFQFVRLRGSLYPISSSRSQDMADIMSSGLEKAALASSWAWCFANRPVRGLDDESRKALMDIIQIIAAEEPLEREAAMTSLPPGVGNVILETESGGEDGEDEDEDDILSQSSYVLSEASLRDSTGSFQETEP
ncbi:MAG: hypothetical protein Q9197_005016 [Variospora fuerteventurae]